MQLALPKKAYRIKCDWERITVLCDTDISWLNHMKKKDIITIDWKHINFAYVSMVEEIDIMKNESIDGAMSWAKKQPWVLSIIATERVMRREEKNHPTKMKISQIVTWMDWFINNWKDRKDQDNLRKFYDLYISSWWDVNLLWPN